MMVRKFPAKTVGEGCVGIEPMFERRWLGKGDFFLIWPFLASMLNLWGAMSQRVKLASWEGALGTQHPIIFDLLLNINPTKIDEKRQLRVSQSRLKFLGLRFRLPLTSNHVEKVFLISKTNFEVQLHASLLKDSVLGWKNIFRSTRLWGPSFFFQKIPRVCIFPGPREANDTLNWRMHACWVI